MATWHDWHPIRPSIAVHGRPASRFERLVRLLWLIATSEAGRVW